MITLMNFYECKELVPCRLRCRSVEKFKCRKYVISLDVFIWFHTLLSYKTVLVLVFDNVTFIQFEIITEVPILTAY